MAIWVPLFASGVLWVAAAPLGRRLPPATAVRLLTAAMLVTAASTGFVLAVAALFVLGQLPGVAGPAHWSSAVLAAEEPVPPIVGVLAGPAVVLLFLAVLSRALTAGRGLRAAARACRHLGPALGGLVVVEDDVPDAYALPGINGRVVVSTGMIRALSAGERRSLLAHEAAHLRHRHHLYVQIAELCASANPALRPAAQAVRVAVERWADEAAAAEVGDRFLAARALARAGLARATARKAVVLPEALAAASGHVVERTRALLAAPPARRPLLTGAVAGSILLTVTAALIVGVGAEDRFELAQTVFAGTR